MKLLIIGGGPGGYVTAVRAAQLGADVTVVEKRALGGTCLNEGCIPTKVFLHTAELLGEMNHAESLGIDLPTAPVVNFPNLMKRKEGIIKTLVSGVNGLLRKNKVKVIMGAAEFTSTSSVSVKKNDGKVETVDFDKAIIATGSKAFVPPIPGADLDGVITSTEGLSLEALPESMTIIGGGVIGVEFGDIFNSLGCKVTIVEMMPRILPPFDKQISDIVRKELKKKGIEIHTDSTVNTIKDNSEGLEVEFTTNGNSQTVVSEKVLISVGRRAYTDSLNAEGIGVAFDRGQIIIDEDMCTNISNIYAIGDCTGKNMLAHVASEQGVIAVERMFGMDSEINYDCVPSGVYTNPEVAAVGLTEEQAKEQGINYKVGKFPLMANGKSLIVGGQSGMVKIIVDEEYGQVIGAHMVGPRATDIIHELALAIRMEATVEEIISTIHAHPTVTESVKEAALDVEGIAIHM